MNTSAGNLSVVIPAYNEEQGIKKTLQELSALGINCEILVIDDGSSDGTSEAVKAFPGVRLIRHHYNKGYGASLKKGIREAKHRWILTMDSDGQHRPKDILEITKSQGLSDLIIGNRFEEKSFQYYLRKPGKYFLKIIANYLVSFRIPDLNSGLRAFDRQKALEFVNLYPNGFSITTTMTLAFVKSGYDVHFVPIKTRKRVGRKSSVAYFKDGLQTIMLIIRVIMLFNPLKIFIPLRLILFFSGFFLSIIGIVQYSRIPQSGTIFILTSIFIFLFGILSDQVAALRKSIQ